MLRVVHFYVRWAIWNKTVIGRQRKACTASVFQIAQPDAVDGPMLCYDGHTVN